MVTVQRLICAQKCTIGTSGTVLIRDVSLFQRLICTQKYTIGTSETILIGEVISEVDLCTKVYYWDLRNYPDCSEVDLCTKVYYWDLRNCLDCPNINIINYIISHEYKIKIR